MTSGTVRVFAANSSARVGRLRATSRSTGGSESICDFAFRFIFAANNLCSFCGSPANLRGAEEGLYQFGNRSLSASHADDQRFGIG